MSETLLFAIGAVISLVVFTAVFVYGLLAFREWEDRDDTAALTDQRASVDVDVAIPATHTGAA